MLRIRKGKETVELYLLHFSALEKQEGEWKEVSEQEQSQKK